MTGPMIRKILVAMVVVAAAVAMTASGNAAPPYSGFTAHVDNPCFPLL